ncbi:hypothetical protein GCM10007276_26110 [Agaricicola taiwanensis]|uniref:TIGR02588 family protein n=1 Tax=Agaricicola taiwanensis TaxID=591372 RepID=A0A8J3DYR5_9RHOB|nr:hypothetical protein [Agaricicola taiwanensis]GGE47656.1 hypothetical protein GCM10007276_26110 [Agaricicola taiwanensis]
MSDMTASEQQKPPKTPALEWIASSIGAIFAVGLISFLTWDIFVAAEPADVSAQPGVIEQASQGYTLGIVVQNTGGLTAAEVEVEGRVTTVDGTEETSQATFDYLPGKSERRGTLMFQTEPDPAQLRLRVVSYREP